MRHFIAIVVVAFGLGLAATHLLADRADVAKCGQRGKVYILLAKRALNMGEQFKVPSEVFGLHWIDEERVAPSVVVIPDVVDPVRALDAKLPNMILLSSLPKGNPLLQRDVYDTSNDVVLRPGFREFGIRLELTDYIPRPSERVDIFYVPPSHGERELLIEDVIVSAVDDSCGPCGGGKPILTKVVTVKLTPEDVLKVMVAKELGSLKMTPRPFGIRLDTEAFTKRLSNWIGRSKGR